ncbi:BTB/POZ domain-containing protein 9-like [Dysidea avara]|uniref:BTB/POZ domain-containing protein 9-like n=1 Tax=Dysidea avara TaxID=196820 RepID=UPI0033290DA1
MEEEPSAKRARNETTSPEGESTGESIRTLQDSTWCVTTFSSLLEDPSTHDVTFKTSDGGSVSAHRVIVAAGSPVFRAMLYGGTKESNQKEIELPTVDSVVLKRLIDFVYTGKVQTTLDDCLDLLQAAHYFGIASLENLCVNMMVASLDLHNYSNTITIAFQQQFDVLFKHCLEMMETRANEIICTTEFLSLPLPLIAMFMELSNLEVKEIDLFLAAVKWHSHQDDALPEDEVKNIFQKIRYPLISVVDLLDKVRPTNLADPDLYKAALEYHHIPEKFNGPEKQIEQRNFYFNFTTNSEELQIEYAAKGTVITKTGITYGWIKCQTMISAKLSQAVRFKLYLKKCASSIRLKLFYESFESKRVSSDIQQHLREVDGSVSMEDDRVCFNVGSKIMYIPKQQFAGQLCMRICLCHTDDSIQICRV